MRSFTLAEIRVIASFCSGKPKQPKQYQGGKGDTATPSVSGSYKKKPDKKRSSSKPPKGGSKSKAAKTSTVNTLQDR